MIIHHYHPETGVFLGLGAADESPLEPGVMLIPAHATEIAPPFCPDGHCLVFEDGSWSTQPVPEPPPAPQPESLPQPELTPLSTRERLEALGFDIAELRELLASPAP